MCCVVHGKGGHVLSRPAAPGPRDMCCLPRAEQHHRSRRLHSWASPVLHRVVLPAAMPAISLLLLLLLTTWLCCECRRCCCCQPAVALLTSLHSRMSSLGCCGPYQPPDRPSSHPPTWSRSPGPQPHVHAPRPSPVPEPHVQQEWSLRMLAARGAGAEGAGRPLCPRTHTQSESQAQCGCCKAQVCNLLPSAASPYATAKTCARHTHRSVYRPGSPSPLLPPQLGGERPATPCSGSHLRCCCCSCSSSPASAASTAAQHALRGSPSSSPSPSPTGPVLVPPPTPLPFTVCLPAHGPSCKFKYRLRPVTTPAPAPCRQPSAANH